MGEVDNVPANKVLDVEDAIEAVVASLSYLPQYSPDLNPIEMVFHPLKALLRKFAARTIAGVSRRIGSFIPTLGKNECIEYFSHAGYAPLCPESALCAQPHPSASPIAHHV